MKPSFESLRGLATLFVVLLALPAMAAVPQTITVDGANDFDPANLLASDGGDTEESNFCVDDPEVDTPMDIKDVYVTNDANNLYIGFEYDRECFASPQVNLGIAFSYGAEGDGSTTDPFNRKIGWNTIAAKPDNVVYAVIDGFNFEVLYQWNPGTLAWDTVVSGSNGLGMANDTGFEEIALPLSSFTNGQAGLVGGQTVKIELWMTQDGTTKPPLDAVVSDAAQTSNPGGTVFDFGAGDPPAEMTGYLDYTVLSVTDTEGPVVTGISLIDGARDQVRVTFNETVSQASSENAGNYLVNGLLPTTATRVSPNVVNLVLPSTLAGNASLYQLDLFGVEDAVGNATIQTYQFALKDIVFEGLFGPFLEANSTGPSDFFTVEGSREPLDFTPLAGDDEMVIFDAVEDIYRLTVPFAWYVGPLGSLPITESIDVEWKFAFNLAFEGGSNQLLTITTANDASTLVSRFWEDLDPSQFTTQAIDVIYTVDMNAVGLQPGDTVELAGNVAPLSFSSPYTPMLDDGLGQDASAGDGIYTVVVTFPTGSLKNVSYKYVFNANFECFGQGDRFVFLNDEVFGTIGSPDGPLTLPLATYDRCTVVAGDTEVIFRVDVAGSAYDVGAPIDVLLTGNVDPLSFDLGGARAAPVAMFDDGVAPDDTAGDKVYTTAVVFPDSSNRFLEYKYVVAGQFEGQGQPNRSVTLSDEFDAGGNPQVLGIDNLNQIIPVGVDSPVRADRMTVSAHPTPFNPRTSIVFEMPSRADVRVAIYDTRGRLLRTLHQGVLGAGEHVRDWDGKTDDGQAVASGVYHARVIGGGFAASARLVLVK